ncbi:FtsW/RodA/SpoVE family cell cycle protein [Oceanotoga sp. DSM 15011]|jgi:cell division protein FtsW|uniref:Probable peptidoglycan glycosyltransferase FtsW n=1 Tax=Oceanotoga teriensis TaxID=515440 RepID=A0AA45C7K3_9BACT|nr:MULTISPECIES: FtsW/RodA/SpoVE family cell cycle protein [Oceanotoga]MDN5342120.1 hypothetical protein [Oceanotoga sp.]MDO7976252.1 FtsW/RodA/SpoVE family cell cycle protein [Oceanotoga teriensis]PWJ95449.1 cell division protein FtsW [Oceanotoga teriensis]UYP01088.1 FtsW/RodA/SpoVE family cell cycle protein [Oceanotoga sp. DSM 15011]
MKENQKSFVFYFILLGITLMLGVFFVYSALYAMEDAKGFDPDRKLTMYIISMGIGFIGGSIAFIFGNKLIKIPIFMISMYTIMLGALFAVMFTSPIAGVRRWITLAGFQFQPSELAKFLLPAFLIFYYDFIRDSKETIFKNILVPIFISLPVILLIMQEPDLSTAIIVSFIAFLTMLISIRNKKLIVILLIIAIIFGITAIYFKDILLTDYQLKRLDKEDNFQTLQSLNAIKSGGLFGKTPFAGDFKYMVPESYSDFIMSIIGEEWGKVGIIIVLTLFYFLSRELIMMSYKTKSYIAFSFSTIIAIWLFIQVTINALVGLGVPGVPVTGVTLPLMSYGNSSLIITLTSIGLSLGLIYFNSGGKSNEKN